MADVTPILINHLTSQTTLQDTDYFIVGGDDAKKITVAQMKEALGINSLNTNMITTEDFTVSTISGRIQTSNGGGNTSLNVSKDGFKALGVVGFSISSSYYAPSGINFNLADEKVDFTMRRVDGATSSESISIYVMVLYVKVAQQG